VIQSFEFLCDVHQSSRSIHYTLDITPQEEIERCQIWGPQQPWDQTSPSNSPTREPNVECVKNDVAIMGRNTVILKNFNSSFLQLEEGVDLKHIEVGGSINSGVSEEKDLISMLWSKPHQTLIFTVTDMLDNFSEILNSPYAAIVPVYYTTSVESGFIHENNSFQIICIHC
jgi:hypothetical protein